MVDPLRFVDPLENPFCGDFEEGGGLTSRKRRAESREQLFISYFLLFALCSLLYATKGFLLHSPKPLSFSHASSHFSPTHHGRLLWCPPPYSSVPSCARGKSSCDRAGRGSRIHCLSHPR